MALAVRLLNVAALICVLSFNTGDCYRSTSKDKQYEKLDAKIDRVGNEVEKIGSQVEALLKHELGHPSTTTWNPLTFVSANRNHSSEGTTFTVVYTSNNKYASVHAKWKITTNDSKTGGDSHVLYLNTFEDSDSSDNELSASITLKDRGLLELIVTSGSYEARLSLDNLNTKSLHQHRIPVYQFAVISPNPLLYWGKEDPVIEVKVQGPMRHEALSSMSLNIQYESEAEDESEISERRCDVRHENRFAMCSSFVKKEYWNSLDAAIVMNSKLQPIGMTTISSNKEEHGQVVTNVRLSKVIEVRPGDLSEPYPDGVQRITLSTSGCEYFSDTCNVTCKFYGRGFQARRMIRSNVEDPEGVLRPETYEESLTSVTYVAKMNVPDILSGVKEDNITCMVVPSNKYEILSRTATIVYKETAKFNETDSYIQLNESLIVLVCTIMAHPLPTVHALLYVTKDNVIIDSPSVLNVTVVKENNVTEKHVYLYENDYGRDIDLYGVCRAWDATGPVASTEVRAVYVITEDAQVQYGEGSDNDDA
ncbi:uncharacterized protein LOC101861675 [Aplysia californica]|uniref:Uncharacterized protein LOC101861675 n=1 Tax=Aplysia californica TaxID=6500 RepID=A0ABM0JXX2_APLCA|nr:uncharacterized protein LOC101861675 [Aplysia californica]